MRSTERGDLAPGARIFFQAMLASSNFSSVGAQSVTRSRRPATTDAVGSLKTTAASADASTTTASPVSVLTNHLHGFSRRAQAEGLISRKSPKA